jgi:tRNA (guanine-N7-)-methyltransferase
VIDRDAKPAFRTFKPRRRQLTPARAELFARLAPEWCLDEQGGVLDPVAVFGRRAPLVLDIGIGFGDSLTTAALADPGVDLIGADVHTPGIASTLARIESMRLSNVRLVHGDALVFLDRLAPSSLSGIRIYFPDPWPKERHRHRRITGASNVERFVSLLRVGGTLHIATDIDRYAHDTERNCDRHPELVGGPIDRPDWRPVTRYEDKGLADGRTVTDLLYRRVGRSEVDAGEGAEAAGEDCGSDREHRGRQHDQARPTIGNGDRTVGEGRDHGDGGAQPTDRGDPQ